MMRDFQYRMKRGPSNQSTNSHKDTKAKHAAQTEPQVLSFFDEYDVIDGAIVTSIDLGKSTQSPLNTHRVSWNGQKIAAGYSDGHVHIFDIMGRTPVEKIRVSEMAIQSLQFHPHTDNELCCVDTGGLFSIWQREGDGVWSNILTDQVHTDTKGVNNFEIRSDVGYLVQHVTQKDSEGVDCLFSSTLGQYSSYTRLFKVEAGKKLVMVVTVGHRLVAKGPNFVSCRPHAKFSPKKESFLISDAHGTIVVWKFEQGVEGRRDLKGVDGEWVDDTRIVTNDLHNNSVGLWNVEGTDGKQPLATVKGRIGCRSLGSVVVIQQGSEQRISVWNVAQTPTLHGVDVQEDDCEVDVCMSSNGKWIVVQRGRRIFMWDAHNFVKVWETTIPEHHYGKGSKVKVAFSPDDARLIFERKVGQEMGVDVYKVASFEGQHLMFKLRKNGYGAWKISADGERIGGVVQKGQSDKGSVRIWNLNEKSAIRLCAGSPIERFCFSLCGCKVAAKCEDGILAIWSIEGKKGSLAKDSAICIQCSKNEGFNWHVESEGLGFSADRKGNEMVVVLNENGCFDWLDVQRRCQAHREKLNSLQTFKHRFSADGHTCAIFYIQSSQVEVWDIVERASTHRLSLKIPKGMVGSLECLNFEQQVSIDGGRLVLGVNQQVQPWLLAANDAVKGKDFKPWDECTFSDYGEARVLGPIGAISEDGKHVATCASLEDSVLHVRVQSIGENSGKLGAPQKVVVFRAGEDSCGQLLMSCNGGRVAWVTENSLQVWDACCDWRCIPTYASLNANELAHDQDTITGMLDAYGESMINYPDKEGWTFLARVIEDRNAEMAKCILDWVGSNEKRIHLGMDIGEGSVVGPCQNVVQLAIKQRNLDCSRLLIDGVIAGSIKCNVGKILGESLYDLIDVYPAIFKDVVCSAHILQENGEVFVPYHIFRDKPFLVCTNDSLSPAKPEQLWSNPVTSLVQCHVWSVVQFFTLWMVNESVEETGLKVPGVSCVIPVDGLAQVGRNGLLGQVLVKGIGSRVFTDLPLRCMIQYKWDRYARELVYNEMCVFVFLLFMFTVYSLLLGHGCQGQGDLTGVMWLAAVVSLGLSIIPSLYGLIREMRQFVTYCNEGRGASYYFLRYKWNVLEFAVYALIVGVVPTFHFLGNPCDSRGGISWVVPASSILLWWKTLYFAQVARSTGPLVLMIFAIMKDIMFFFMIGCGVLFGFGVAFFVLYRGDEANADAFGSLNRTLLTVFAMMLGDFDLDMLYSSPIPALAIMLFVAYVLVMAIILLNLLIAIMGDSFDRIKGTEEEQFFMVRASVIDDMEAMLSSSAKREIGEGIGRFVHVLLPKDRVEEIGEWHGRIIELEHRFKRISDELKAEVGYMLQEGTSDLHRKIVDLSRHVGMEIIEQKEDIAAVKTTSMKIRQK